MKKTILFALILVLLLSACAAPAAQPETAAEPIETELPIETIPHAADYIGAWQDRVSQRATMNLYDMEDVAAYTAVITWGSSAFETTVWTLPCFYDEATGRLTYDGGKKAELTFSEDGTSEKEELLWEGSEGALSLNADGEIEWEDSKEESAPDVRFVRVYSEVPSQTAFVEEYFHTVGAAEQGTAGSSLKLCLAAYNAFAFASRYQIWNTDIPALRDAMLEAWESMTDDERSAFDANFIDAVRLIDAAMSDWEGAKAGFDDAGVGAEMEQLLQDPIACASWRTLLAHTLTMGNSDG